MKHSIISLFLFPILLIGCVDHGSKSVLEPANNNQRESEQPIRRSNMTIYTFEVYPDLDNVINFQEFMKYVNSVALNPYFLVEGIVFEPNLNSPTPQIENFKLEEGILLTELLGMIINGSVIRSLEGISAWGTSMTYLTFEKCQIDNISAVVELKNLRGLDFTDCEVMDFSPILKMENLPNLTVQPEPDSSAWKIFKVEYDRRYAIQINNDM